MPRGTKFLATPEQRRQVELMIAAGIDQKLIARILGFAHGTLEKYFREEIRLGSAKAIAAVAGNLFRIATKRAKEGKDEDRATAAACMFILKTRARWQEVARPIEIEGAGPVKVYIPDNGRG